jgi:hypothetical protein
MQDPVIFTTHKHTHRPAAAEQRNGVSPLSIVLHICCMGASAVMNTYFHTLQQCARIIQGMAAIVTTAAS